MNESHYMGDLDHRLIAKRTDPLRPARGRGDKLAIE